MSLFGVVLYFEFWCFRTNFFYGTVRGNKYLEILMDQVVPQLQQQGNSHDLYFQQDGAPLLYSRAVHKYLDETFPEKWIDRRGPTDWPACSADFTPMDFFLWGIRKDKVYGRKHKVLVIWKITLEMHFKKLIHKVTCANMFVEAWKVDFKVV